MMMAVVEQTRFTADPHVKYVRAVSALGRCDFRWKDRCLTITNHIGPTMQLDWSIDVHFARPEPRGGVLVGGVYVHGTVDNAFMAVIQVVNDLWKNETER